MQRPGDVYSDAATAGANRRRGRRPGRVTAARRVERSRKLRGTGHGEVGRLLRPRTRTNDMPGGLHNGRARLTLFFFGWGRTGTNQGEDQCCQSERQDQAAQK